MNCLKVTNEFKRTSFEGCSEGDSNDDSDVLISTAPPRFYSPPDPSTITQLRRHDLFWKSHEKNAREPFSPVAKDLVNRMLATDPLER